MNINDDTDNEKYKHYVKIYPIYLDKDFKQSDGRKARVEHSVEGASSEEIYNIVKSVLNLNCEFQYKHHPKDWLKRGRVIVEIKDSDKKVLNTDTGSSKFYINILYKINLYIEKKLIKIIGELLVEVRKRKDEIKQKEKKEEIVLEEEDNGGRKKRNRNKKK